MNNNLTVLSTFKKANKKQTKNKQKVLLFV